MEHRATLSCSKIPGSDAGMVFPKVIESDEVALGEVEDVDVIADGGAVVGGIVCCQGCQQAFSVGATAMRNSAPTITKDEQLIPLSCRYLGEEREQIVRDALWIFSHDTARV